MHAASIDAPDEAIPAGTERLVLRIGEHRFAGHLETGAAPLSCAWLRQRLPLEGTLLQARWSGEAGWVPLGAQTRLAAENATRFPRPGQILVYAGERSEAEILIAYGACAFACRAGALAGNHVISLHGDMSALPAIGEELLRHGGATFRLEIQTARRAP